MHSVKDIAQDRADTIKSLLQELLSEQSELRHHDSSGQGVIYLGPEHYWEPLNEAGRHL